MALAPGTRLGSYEIVAPLGAGGMGEVYRAKDTRLGRSAAIKTLPPEFALDEDRRARFEREAKTLATLNHPHIAQIYGLEDVPGASGGPPALALAMELVEGEDLAQRLTRGPVPLDDVWPLARQIAEGLEAAHEAGIVHRDLKPANLRVTPEGVVKVLDFGLAKPMEPVGSGALATHSPTLTSPALTTRGVVLGTASYMAPEQAKGRPVDRRADIWAFGCVVYELLTGRRAFPGDDVPEILGAILKTEPDWSALPAATPTRVRTLLRRCLAKDKTQRLQHIGDARLELDDTPLRDTSTPSASGAERRASWSMLVAAVTLVGAGAVLGPALRRPAETNAPAAPVQFELPIQGRFSLSPGGAQLAYTLADRTVSTLWLRDLAAAQPRQLGPVEGGAWLEWLPDGSAIYNASQEGRRRFVPSSGVMTRERSASPLVLGARFARGVAVLADGRMVFGAGPTAAEKRLMVWSQSGGGPLIELDSAVGEVRQAEPGLWGNDLLSYQSVRADDQRFLCLTSVSTPAPRCVGPLGQSGRSFYERGWVLFARDRTLLARGFDPTAAAFTSDEKPLAGDLAFPGTMAQPRVSAAGSTVAFAVDSGGDTVEWRTPLGSTTPLLEIATTSNFALSPDSTRLLTVSAGNLLLTDLSTMSTARIGTSGGDPVWAPDGQRLAHRSPAGELTIRSLDRQGDERVLSTSTVVFPEDWSRDGRWIAAVFRDGSDHLGLIPASGGTPLAVVSAGSDLANPEEPHFSPDGKWLAFNALSGDRDEVFVVPVPPTGQRWQVSTSGGVQARWHPNGKALYYLESDGAVMALDMAAGPAFRATAPRKHFDLGFTPARQFDDYRIAADGRFLIKRPAPGKVRVIVNWPALLK